MVVDTSAAVAILLREPEEDAFVEVIADAARPVMAAVSLVEASIVLEGRLGESAGRDLDDFLRRSEIEVVATDVLQADEARRAWRRFGMGNHPARLNFGDCFAYALATTRGEPLLFKGEDFARTDVVSALAS
jgi:ribonuclease VapC